MRKNISLAMRAMFSLTVFVAMIGCASTRDEHAGYTWIRAQKANVVISSYMKVESVVLGNGTEMARDTFYIGAVEGDATVRFPHGVEMAIGDTVRVFGGDYKNTSVFVTPEGTIISPSTVKWEGRRPIH